MVPYYHSSIGLVVYWLGCWWVQVSAITLLGNNLRLVVCAHMPLSASNIIWYWSKGSDAPFVEGIQWFGIALSMHQSSLFICGFTLQPAVQHVVQRVVMFMNLWTIYKSNILNSYSQLYNQLDELCKWARPSTTFMTSLHHSKAAVWTVDSVACLIERIFKTFSSANCNRLYECLHDTDGCICNYNLTTSLTIDNPILNFWWQCL